MNESINIILQSDELPSPPGVAAKLLEIFEDPDATMKMFADLIAADPALSVKIIDYCNSPLLGRPNKTTNLQQALVALGLRTVKMIALSFSLIQTGANNNSGFDHIKFWNRSLSTALISRHLFNKFNNTGDDAFLVGLTMNIGQMALAHVYPNEFASITARVESAPIEKQSLTMARLCRDKWGGDQYTIGSHLLKEWNFPASIYEVIENYGEEFEQHGGNMCCFGFAERFANLLFCKDYTLQDIEKLCEETTAAIEIDDEQFDALFDDILVEWAEYAKLLSLDSIEVKDLRELENRARKNINQLTLALSVENESMRQENEQLNSRVMIDCLTGLKNRRAYDMEVEAELERARRSYVYSTIIVADIDFFKSINDKYGHQAGDAVLAKVANVLKASVRKYDSVYRYGGEEFILTLYDCTFETAKSIANRIRSAVESTTIVYEGQQINVTISQGAVCVSPEFAYRLPRVFEMADSLLYKAKSSGRNTSITEMASNMVQAAPTPPLNNLEGPGNLQSS